MQQLTISKILYIIEKFNDEICVIARRNNEYSKFVGKDEVNESLDVLYNKYKNTGKKVALNLQHTDTIEFRMFKSTLKYETFILTLEFVKNLVDYAKKINVEEIELIKWDDLMDTFSDELKEYYHERLNKEKEKAKEKTDDKAFSENIDAMVNYVNNSIASISASIDAFESLSCLGSITIDSSDSTDTWCTTDTSEEYGNRCLSNVYRPYDGIIGT
jgi:hypothetical protein